MRPPLRALLAASLFLLGACAAHPAPIDRPTPDPDWDAAFARDSGWNGGDIAHAVDLHDHRTLWLFGDSFFGPVHQGRRIPDHARMLRAAVAWHPTPAQGLAPDPKSISFAGPEPFDDLPVVPWATPDHTIFPPDSWFWLMNDAVRLPDRLVLFATVVGPSGNPDGMWNFRRVAGAVLSIPNADDPPTRWLASQRVNPLVTPDPRFGEPPRHSDNLALAVVRWPLRSTAFALFGVHYAPDGSKRLSLAHANADDLDRPDRWILDPPDTSRPLVPDEFTIHAVTLRGAPALLLVYAEPFANRSVWARSARNPRGPWSAPVALASIPDPSPGVFTYGVKAHPHLSRPGELLVSYATNADLARVVGDASLYRPRFIRIPWTALPQPP